jgi:Fe-S-cluster-containing hydrogenase component 2
MKILSTPRMERCIGCHSCSLACGRACPVDAIYLHPSGFDPASVKVPERFKQVDTWKGPLDTNYPDSLQKTYSQKIREMGKSDESGSP